MSANFEVDHKCGHVQAHDLSDVAAGQRAGRVTWLGTRPCIDCFKKTSKRKISKEVQAERDQAEKEALEDQERSQLPLLSGSEKQVSWALRSRFELLRAAYDNLVGELGDEGFEEQVMTPARRINAARWWIDNREANTEQLLECIADPGEEFIGNENPY